MVLTICWLYSANYCLLSDQLEDSILEILHIKSLSVHWLLINMQRFYFQFWEGALDWEICYSAQWHFRSIKNKISFYTYYIAIKLKKVVDFHHVACVV